MYCFEKMKNDPYDIYIWGVGSFAKDVYLYCENFSINIKGFFANMGEIPNEYLGYPVITVKNLNEKSKISILIGHSQYEYGMNYLSKQPYIANVYALTRASYGMWDVISKEDIDINISEWKRIRNKCGDSLSLDCINSYISSLLDDDPTKMFDCYFENEGYFNHQFLYLNHQESYLDIGCYIGGTIKSFHEAVNGRYVSITAFEPEENNFKIALNNVEKNGLKNVKLIKKGVWNKCGFVSFDGDGELGHVCGDGKGTIEAVSIDSLGDKFTVIKINFAFGISEILDGARSTINEIQPKIIIRVGFNEAVIREAFNKILEINDKYNIYFRYTLGMPEGLTLFAI